MLGAPNNCGQPIMAARFCCVSLDNFAGLLVQANPAAGSEIMLPPVLRLSASNTGIGLISIIHAEGVRGC
jgi:hypothetical protein